MTRRVLVLTLLACAPSLAAAQHKYTDAAGKVRVALAKQPFLPDGKSPGPNTMAGGGMQGRRTSRSGSACSGWTPGCRWRR